MFIARNITPFLVSLFLLVSLDTSAQQSEQSSLYMFNTLYYNPAYAGTRNTLSISALAREQWVGIENAPSSQFLSVHTPVNNRLFGVGVHFNNDKVGSRQKTSAMLDISSGVKLNSRNDRLNIGLSVGVENYSLNFSDLFAVDNADYILNGIQNKTAVNTGFGVYYFGERHYLGLSVPSILETAIEQEGAANINLNQRHYHLQAGYVFRLSSVIDFKPSTLVKYTVGAPLVFDLNASLLFYEKFWVGAMYRYDEGVGINLAAVLFDNLTVAYAYDFPINRLMTFQKGSHEVGLIFDLSLYKEKGRIYSPRYF